MMIAIFNNYYMVRFCVGAQDARIMLG